MFLNLGIHIGAKEVSANTEHLRFHFCDPPSEHAQSESFAFSHIFLLSRQLSRMMSFELDSRHCHLTNFELSLICIQARSHFYDVNTFPTHFPILLSGQ